MTHGDLILASGAGVLDDQYEMRFFAGDDLLVALRPRGLPICTRSASTSRPPCLRPRCLSEPAAVPRVAARRSLARRL
jgi:hypothetical protein